MTALRRFGFGESALLRKAGCPIRYWTSQGMPDLFARLRELDLLKGRYVTLSKELADTISSDLVPNGRLQNCDLRRALEVAVRLRGGQTPRQGSLQHLLGLFQSESDEDVREKLSEITRLLPRIGE